MTTLNSSSSSVDRASLLALVKEASEIMTITYAGNFPAGIESFLVRAHAALLATPQEPPALRDDSRCAICGWPLAETTKAGCVRGNCSMRPFPEYYYDPTRAQREYKSPLPPERRPNAALDPPAPPSDGWQDIATAPKATSPHDGHVLLWNGYRRAIGRFVVDRWLHQNLIGEPLGLRDGDPETHWMPLPAPPPEGSV